MLLNVCFGKIIPGCFIMLSVLNDEEAKDVVNDVFELIWMNFEKLSFLLPCSVTTL